MRGSSKQAGAFSDLIGLVADAGGHPSTSGRAALQSRFLGTQTKLLTSELRVTVYGVQSTSKMVRS